MWMNTKYQRPPEGQIVETKIVDEEVGDHNICKLIRHGNLWFFTDMKMYVYYVPTHWRYIQDKGD